MEGHVKLALLMSEYPETLIFRRFGAISAQNLLYLQAELVHLEHELQECTLPNNAPGRDVFSKDWFMFAHFNEGTEQQWCLILQIRAKLKEYGRHQKLLIGRCLCWITV